MSSWGSSYYIREIISKLKAMLEKVKKIPGGKKAAEALEKLKELVKEFLDQVRETAPDPVRAAEQMLREAGLFP